MATLILKIGFPPGAIIKYKLLKVKQIATVKESIEEIVKSNLEKSASSTSSREYALAIPSSSPDKPYLWLDDDKTISSYSQLLPEKSLVELKTRYQIIHLRYYRAPRPQAFIVDINQPIEHILPSVSKKFQLDDLTTTSYSLVQNKKELDWKKSIRAQSIPVEVLFHLKLAGQEIEDEAESVPQKSEEEEEAANKPEPLSVYQLNDLQQIPAKSIKDPQKSEQLNFRTPKLKKYENRFFVLKDIYLLQYKSASEKKPIAVIDLQKITKKNLEEQDKKSKDYLIELTGEEIWTIKFDNESQFKNWSNALDTAYGIIAKANGAGVFGEPISNAVLPGKTIPDIVEQCVNYIDKKALDVVGIFRLSGSAVKIEQYRKAFNQGVKVDLSNELDPHAVAGLLKLYFRELPEPIMTYSLYDQFIATESAPDYNLKLRYLKNLLTFLPKLNYELLKYLMQFLGKVNAHSEVNKMGIPNLATIFGPNLLKPPDNSTLQMVQDAPYVYGIINSLISEYDFFFTDKKLNEIKGVALFDYEAQTPSEISFKQGDVITIITKAESADDWWQGEVHGQIGLFPGTYVQLKTKAQQFKEDLKNEKAKLQEEKESIELLLESKQKLESQISQLHLEAEKFEQDTKQLQDHLLTMLVKENKLDNFVTKFDRLFSRLKAYREAETKLEEVRKLMNEDMEELRNLVSLSSSVEKKGLKKSSQEKLDPMIGMMIIKFNAELKKRSTVTTALNDLYYDCAAFTQLVHYQPPSDLK